jgi:molybdopterin synthase sulfur carrier subunit
VGSALEAVFRENPRARAYVLDEQGAVRQHMVVFVDGQQVRDRQRLTDPVAPTAEIYVAQALSGG